MACHWLLLPVGIAEVIQSAYAKVFVLRFFLLMVGYKCEKVIRKSADCWGNNRVMRPASPGWDRRRMASIKSS